MGDRITTAVAAKGRWKMILRELGVPAKLLNKRNQPCPFCGGRDRFQWKDYDGSGGYICRQCGNGDGFHLLMKLYGWSFKETAKRIDHLIANDYRISLSPASFVEAFIAADNQLQVLNPYSGRMQDVEIPKSVRDCALWIRKYHPDKLQDWLKRHEIEVRWWLETQA